jgi:hypothetical protein
MGTRGPGWPEAVVAVFFVAFAGLAVFLGVEHDKFLEVWAGVGTVVGVLTGAIPGYFFAKSSQSTTIEAQQSATQAQESANQAQESLEEKVNKLTSLLAVAPPDIVDEAKKADPSAW